MLENGHARGQALAVAEYDVTFDVAPAPPASVASSATSVWKAVVSAATGIAAIVGAFVALRGLRRRRATPVAGDDEGA